MKFLFQSLGFILLIAALKAIGGWAAFLSLLVSIYAIIHTFRYFHRRKREREQATMPASARPEKSHPGQPQPPQSSAFQGEPEENRPRGPWDRPEAHPLSTGVDLSPVNRWARLQKKVD